MFKKLALICCIFISPLLIFAQRGNAKTVLFLMPFFEDDYPQYSIYSINSASDIYNQQIFSMVSFWEGAMLALDEYENKDVPVHIIVKDITNENQKLIEIMEDEKLMSSVNLIIGPFFAQQFEMAASYAKEYKIPIVNPFTSKSDIILNNEFVYKVVPSRYAQARYISKMITPSTNVILWTDKNPDDPQILAYKSSFTNQNVDYHEIIDNGNVNVKSALSPYKNNLVIPFFNSEASVIANLRALGIAEDLPATTFVIPQEWLEINELEVDYLEKLNVHFFSNYFIDSEADESIVFKTNFLEKYSTPPDIKYFSFQGYDITKYFIELMLNDFNPLNVSFHPVALSFDFQKSDNDGYENQSIFYLQLKDYKIQKAE